MFCLSTSSLIDSESFRVVLIYLDRNGDSILQKSSWPVWTDFEAFIETISVYHHEATLKRGGSVENIKQTFIQKVDDFIQSEPEIFLVEVSPAHRVSGRRLAIDPSIAVAAQIDQVAAPNPAAGWPAFACASSINVRCIRLLSS